MANWSDPRTGASPFAGAPADTRSVTYDAGLRAYMLSVYNYMASGVLLTGIVAAVAARFGFTDAMIADGGRGLSALGWIVAIAPLGVVFAMSFGQSRMATGTLRALFWTYAVLMGLSLSTIFLSYNVGSIAGAFFATAAGFAGLSLWGYTTERDLSGFGTFLIVGLVGILVASLINVFLGSSVVNLVISIVGVLIFAGLTAYDTQRTKSLYSYVAGTDQVGRVVVMSALKLYLDFINMFLFILRLFGSGRN
ncbi:Bax inhibitor-1/YccA family protein [Sphingomonas sp.]|uniref:Bax inhibitor-1/YccA family protein n=1 Tax=Sphingomonas sp. TaxID=28214 RepID=UPI003CC57558